MKKFIPLLFLISFLSLLIGANIYLVNRFSLYFSLESSTLLYFLFASITVFMIVGLIVFTNAITLTANYAYIIASVLMGFMLYLLLSVNLIDLIHLFVDAKGEYFGFAAIILAGFISGYGIINSFNTKVIAVKIPIKGLKKQVRAMHLSDIHIGHFRGKKFLNKIVDKTNNENVDIVFITGDLFDGKIRLKSEHLEPLKKLKAPIYFVEGNHDGYSGVSLIKKKLREIGVNVLENEITNWGELQIIGLNHMLADDSATNMRASNGMASIKKVLNELKTDEKKPKILLHHSPDGIQYANQNKVDLYLAGHTHAGQMFPINQITKLIFTFNKGLHDFNGTKIYVSQGAGTFGPPMRIGTNSEIAVLTLMPN